MIRRLIILLLIVGCLFGDTIKYKSSLFTTDTKENVDFLGVGKNQSICFKSNNDIECISCKLVKEVIIGGVILDSSNDFDCNKRTYYGKSPKKLESNPKYTGSPLFVIIFVVIFGIIVIPVI